MIKEKTIAVVCLTIIAVFAMYLIHEPDNIITNVVVAIAAFITGERFGQRKSDNGVTNERCRKEGA